MIRVERAVGYLAVQDLGRPGHRAAGVPAGGAMDPVALRLANLLVGNAEGDAALEWSVGEMVLRFDRATRVAVAGLGARVTLDDVPAPLWTTLAARRGSRLRLEPASGGRFCYVALDGGIDVAPVLGSRATYLPARLGGHEGRALRSGDAIPIGARKAGARRAPPPGTTVPDTLRPSDAPGEPIRLVAAAQEAVLDDAGSRLLLDSEHRVGAGDRMGYRLDGPAIPTRAAAALPSEGACAGALQLPGDGHAIVLMPDGPTVGGYPKPAVVASVDLPRLAQRAAGAAVRFSLVDVAEAQWLRRELEERLDAARRAVGSARSER
ncbi:MAG TPA: biotin-dependent carboxyltransferase family protein [Gemmatimonadaceae bacterium]